MFSDNETSKFEENNEPTKSYLQENNINKDKLVNNFLNNTLRLDKYHYLKSFNLDKLNNWNQISYIY